jgi:hypothetical protein
MSKDTQFKPGQSGNPKGRPRKRRPNVSAFDIIFDKTLTVTQNGVARELTIDEALELQTYHSALKGSRMAIRQVLKMIEKREAALAKKNPAPAFKVRTVFERTSDNANEAMSILGIADHDPGPPDLEVKRRTMRLASWATQAALGRPGRRKFDHSTVKDIKLFTRDSDTLRWPPGRIA